MLDGLDNLDVDFSEAGDCDLTANSKPFSYVEKFDLKVHVVSDRDGIEYMVKVDVSDRELEDIKAASELEFPEDLKKVISIPKLISDDKSLLPDELVQIDGNVIIMEKAAGEELLSLTSGAQPFSVDEQTWCKFGEAIRFMNENGVVHKDIAQTDNIFVSIDEDGGKHFELVDWGGALNPDIETPEDDSEGFQYLTEQLGRSGFITSMPKYEAEEPEEVLSL